MRVSDLERQVSARVAAVAAACVDAASALHRSALAPDVARLSALFTRERGARQRDYMRDPALRRAYLGFFVPHNVARIAGVLLRAQLEGALPTAPPRVLDLGAGPLSASLAAWCVWGTLRQVTAVDLSRPALEYGAALFKAVGADCPIDLRDAPLDGPPQRFRPNDVVDVIIAANVLNELSDPRDLGPRLRCVQNTMAWLSPEGRFLAIEPAMRVEARALMALRDAVVGTTTVLSPCRGAPRCPLLETRGDWCHQDIAFADRPPSYRALERAAGLPKDHLAVAHLLLARRGASPETGLRVVGGVMVGGDGVERRYACGRTLVTLQGRPRLAKDIAAVVRGGILADGADGIDDVGGGSVRDDATAPTPPRGARRGQIGREGGGPGERRPRQGPRRR